MMMFMLGFVFHLKLFSSIEYRIGNGDFKFLHIVLVEFPENLLTVDELELSEDSGFQVGFLVAEKNVAQLDKQVDVE
jgi:hypothetical protein